MRLKYLGLAGVILVLALAIVLSIGCQNQPTGPEGITRMETGIIPASSKARANIVVRARGVGGSEHINLRVGGSTVADWTLSTSYQNYSASTNNSGEVTVCFDNDDGQDRDVQVDYIEVDGERRQAEDQSYNTGVWQNDECGGGNGGSEWLHCEGCIGFGSVSGGGGGGATTTAAATTTSGSSWWGGGSWWGSTTTTSGGGSTTTTAAASTTTAVATTTTSGSSWWGGGSWWGSTTTTAAASTTTTTTSGGSTTTTTTSGGGGGGEVTRSGNTWTAKVGGSTVYTGSRMFDAVTEACNNMGSGTIHIRNSGDSGNDGGDVYAIRPKANQTLDFHGSTVNCNSNGDLVVVVHADKRDGITVKNLRVTGNPRYGLWFRGCSNVTLTDITMDLSNDSPVGLGIRVDASTGSARNLTINGNISITGSAGHAIETYSVDGVNIGDVTVNNTGGCGVLLNDSRNCNVGTVTGNRNCPDGGYATFRVANTNGYTHCAGVYSRNSGRGFFSVSDSRDCTVEYVDIANCRSQCIFLEDATNTHVLSGTISNGNPNCQMVRCSNCSINVSGCN